MKVSWNVVTNKPITKFSVPHFISMVIVMKTPPSKTTPNKANSVPSKFPICLMLSQILQFSFTKMHNISLQYAMYLKKVELSTEIGEFMGYQTQCNMFFYIPTNM